MELKRGEIYYITFPYTLDPKYPNGKPKFVLVLQEGEYFAKYNTVEIMLITSDKQYKPREKYATDVEIEVGTTKLKDKSWVLPKKWMKLTKLLILDYVWGCSTNLHLNPQMKILLNNRYFLTLLSIIVKIYRDAQKHPYFLF